MIVHRYEHKYTGEGPYSGVHMVDYLLADHNARQHGDRPVLDPYTEETLKYGCVSAAALDEWFEGWEELLQQRGFVKVQFIVPDDEVIYGEDGMQCAFPETIGEYV